MIRVYTCGGGGVRGGLVPIYFLSLCLEGQIKASAVYEDRF